MGWSALSTGDYLPTLAGNAYSMLAGEDALYMVLSSEQNNCLVRVDYTGRLMNYSATSTSRAYRDLDVKGDTVYAIVDDFVIGDSGCGNVQALASLSLKGASMKPRTLLDLKEVEGVPSGVVWQEVYAPGEDEETVRLAGIGADGQGWLLRWTPDRGPSVEKVAEGEKLFRLKYVSENRLVWICQDGRVGQEVDGARRPDVLDGWSDTPNHISTCKERCFLSDSVSGDIFELDEEGKVERFRAGEEEIGQSGYTFQELEIFTTYQEEDGVRVIGLCAGLDGNGSAVAGETRQVTALSAGPLRLLMLWEHGWQAALWAFGVLAVLTWLVRGLARSPRLAVRLVMGEVVIALALTAALTGVELSFLKETIREDGEQMLQMVGKNLAAALSGEEEMDETQTAETLERVLAELEDILGGQSHCGAGVYWDTPHGPAVGYDGQIPAGCLALDVKSRAYCALLRDALDRGPGAESGVREVQNANNTDFAHATVFTQGGRTGCVVASRPMEALIMEQAAFLRELVMALCLCPVLFLGLILMTRRLLRPLRDVRAALEEFYETGGGNQIELRRMPKTELYEVSRVFNELSKRTRVQFNKLSTINGAYVRLVPGCLLDMLGKEDIQALAPGDHVDMDGAILLLVPPKPARTAERLEEFLEPAAQCVHRFGGMPVDYDEGLGALTALFQDPAQAKDCAREYLAGREEEGVTAALFCQRVELGVFGGEGLMLPLAVSQDLHRKQEAARRLASFGAVLVLAGEDLDVSGLRCLGWDGGSAFWEDPSCRPGRWQGRWPGARALWEKSLTAYAQGDFSAAMGTLTRTLRVLPGDGAVRWYLFRCAALRDGKEPSPDLGLLWDWRDERG